MRGKQSTNGGTVLLTLSRSAKTVPRNHNSIPNDGASPLYAACAEGHEPVVQILLAHGADTEKTVGSSGTPLQAAIRGNHLRIVPLLLDAGANVDQGLYDTPLSEASRDGNVEMVEDFLKTESCISDPPTVKNARSTACTRRQRAPCELLFEAPSGTEREARVCADALSTAIESCDDETVRLLLAQGTALTAEMLFQSLCGRNGGNGNDAAYQRDGCIQPYESGSSAERRAIVELLLRHRDKIQIRECVPPCS